jgi:Uma2 family endonuclease
MRANDAIETRPPRPASADHARLVVRLKQRRTAYLAVMSSEAVGRHMPTVVTLDDLTAMMAADEFHRYEISPEGALSITLPGYAHAIAATRLTVWLATAGVPAERIAQAVGLRIPGRGGTVGGRIPDPVVWSKPQSDAVWLPVADVLLVVEIMSPGSEGTDMITKRNEYAAAGIPQYWIVDQDPAQTVTMHRLADDHFTVHATMPLVWVLNTNPDEHNLC